MLQKNKIIGHQKILNLLNEINNSKFVTRRWNIANNNSKSNYAAANEITYNTEMLKSNLCDYNDDYILVTGNITVIAAPQTQVEFKNCGRFTKWITKIDGTTIDDAEDLNLVMPVHNLIEYSSNYSEATNFNADIANTDNFKHFKCKAKLLGNTVAQLGANSANAILRNASIAVQLKYLSNFWRSLEMPLINCKV